MTLMLRIILIVSSLITYGYAIRKIRKSQMKIENAIYWFFFTVFILLLSFFPQIGVGMAKMIGIESPVNLIYLVIIFLLIGKMFFMSIRMAQMEHRFDTMVEEVAIWRKQLEEKQDE